MFAIGDREWPGISKLVEESGEVVQVCGKLMAMHGAVLHPDGTDLRLRLQGELGDLLAAIDFVSMYCDLDDHAIERQREKKAELFERWHEETRRIS